MKTYIYVLNIKQTLTFSKCIQNPKTENQQKKTENLAP